MDRRRIRRRRRREERWNRLSCGLVAVFLLLAVLTTYVFIKSSTGRNPFSNPAGETQATQSALTTEAPTRLPAATHTPTPTIPPSATPTRTRTATQEPAAADGHNPATTPIPTKTLVTDYPFILHGQQKMLDASTFDVKHTCSWQGVAGQTFDLLNRPLPGILVQVSGVLGPEKLEMISMSGTVLTYGPAGYEIFLADQVTESNGTLFIRLIDEAGKPLSEQVPLVTSGDCRKNLVVVNFKKVKE